MTPASWPWFCAGVAVTLNALVCAPLGFRRRWPPSVMVPGIIATAALLSASIVGAYGWRALYGFLLVLFPVHAVVFAAVGLARRKSRYMLTVSIFLALTGVMWINYSGIDAPLLRIGLRVAAIGFTVASGLAIFFEKKRRSAPA